MRILFIVTAVLLLYGKAFAQTPHVCASDSLWKSDTNYLQRQAAFAAELAEFRSQPPTTHNYWPYQDSNSTQTVTAGCKRAVYIIPVVVHIDESGGTVNVTDGQVQQQIALLNTRYENHGIRFTLARRRPNGTAFTGINRFSGSFDYRFQNLAAAYASNSSYYYNPSNYLNIYVVPTILSSDGSPSTINGFNQRFANAPIGPDLVVVRYTKFGDYTNCTSCGTLSTSSRGLVLVHETGHYLGLRELWQGGCAEGNTATTCATQGDLCCDTRPINANYQCPAPSGNDCSYYLSIADNHENYMDYTGEACQNNFTADQVSLMHATLERYRNQLIAPQNLNNLLLADCFASAWFDADDNFLCDSGTFTLRAIAYDSAINYHWTIRRNGIPVVDTTLTTDSLLWAADSIGIYNVTLKIRYGTQDSAEVQRTNFLQVAGCGTAIASQQGNWYFGNEAGLRFTAGGAIRDSGPFSNRPNINTTEGSFSHSRSNGQLLFYGGGSMLNIGSMDVYNRNYRPMPNSPVIGDFSASQAAAVIPMPGGDTNQYILFTVAGTDANNLKGFRFNLIDMALNGGLGDIVPAARNTPIPAPAGFKSSPLDSAVLVNEQIVVIPKCNGRDYWVLATSYNDTFPFSTNILVFSADTAGINFAGTTNTPTHYGYGVGQLKSSPDGNWLYLWGQVLRFDKATGTITPYKTILDGLAPAASFSPNSKLLYANDIASNIYQFDLESGNDSLSKTFITQYPFQSGSVNFQLGPDNRIYISKYGSPSLAHILFPDSNITLSLTNAPQYSYNGPVLSANGIGGSSLGGLPNMMDAKLPNQLPLDFTVIDSACGNITFIPNNACAGIYRWYFGDGDSSFAREPFHSYNDTGFYTVTLTINGSTVVQKTISVGILSKIQGTDTACIVNGNMVNYSISNRNDEISYTWGVINGSSTIDPYNNLSVLWNNGAGKVFLTMVNPKNGCTATDTLSIIPNFLDSNLIWPDSILCSGSPLHIYGSVATSSLGSVSYLWQFSNNNITWNSLTDSLQNLSGQTQDTTLWYRRLVKQGSCSFASDAKKIIYRPRVYIHRQPQNSVTCVGGERAFNIGIYTPPGVNVTPKWQYQLKGNTVWSSLVYLGDSISDWPTSIAYDSAKFICTIVTPCGTLVSDTAYVLIEKSPNILSHPQSQIKAEGDSALFIVSSSAIKPDYIWYYSRDNGLTWDSIAGEHNDTLIVRNITSCENRFLYRVVTTTCNNETSDTARLTVTTQRDLWSRDGVADIGNEPNVDPNNDYWGSPDLWNCWPDSVCTTHKSPEYVSIDWNYLRTTVRNRGTQPSTGFEVKTYWTLGGFYEQWSKSWLYDTINNGFYDSITMRRYPMGGEIGTKVATSIPAGSTRTFNFQWAPPYPGWYTNSAYFDSSRLSHPICILSRIEACPDTPFGMTYPEIVPTGVNVKNNNNIVTRNTEVFDSIGTNKKTPEWVLRMGNQWSEGRVFKLFLNNNVTNFWDLGYLVIQLDPSLYYAWQEGGALGEGFVADGQALVITDDGFFLDNIELTAGQWGWVHFQFRLYPETVMDTDRGQQLFNFIQSSSLPFENNYEPDGGFNFLLNLKPDSAYVDPHIDSLSFLVVPNPTEMTETVDVDIDMNFSTSTAVLNIYDTWGNSVIEELELGTLVSGENTRSVYIAELGVGTYSVVITANGHNYTQTMVIVN